MKGQIMNNNNSKVSSCIDTICNNFENSILEIMNIKYYYDLKSIFSIESNLSEDDKYSLYENLINSYLFKIKELNKNIELNKFNRKIDDYLYFFSYRFDNQNEEDLSDVESEGDEIADDLYLKLIGINNRNLELPINLKEIINYQIHSLIDDKDVEKVIQWIILKLAIMYTYLKKEVVKVK